MEDGISSQGLDTLLRSVWGVDCPLDRVGTGVSRRNWRVGEHYWLTCCEGDWFDHFDRETRLLAKLDGVAGERISAPKIIVTRAGTQLFQKANSWWRLTTRLPGIHPDPTDLTVYEMLTRALSRVHLRFAKLNPTDQWCEHGIVAQLPRRLNEIRTKEWLPVTDDADEAAAIQGLASWLLGQTDLINHLPGQFVHGDWNPGNVLLSMQGPSLSVTGVLDFEFAAVDPVEVDIAQLCSTVLMWSDSGHRAPALIDQIIKMYGLGREGSVSSSAVFACMAAYWLSNYCVWRRRFERTGRFKDVLMRQTRRIRAVLQFVKGEAGFA